MTLNQLLYFQVIANLENYRNAANVLNISQPSLSRSMASLEEELGIMLFEKSGRGITLTKYGNLFLSYTNRILEEYNLALYKMKGLTVQGGRIDIGFVYPLANNYIPHKVRKFLNQEENKDTTFTFHQDVTTGIIKELKMNKLDIGFGSYIPNEHEIEFIPLVQQELVIIVSKNHELAAYDSLPIEVLQKYPVIGYNRYSSMGTETENLYRRMDLRPNIAIECPDENSIGAMVREDFGIALIAKISHLDTSKLKLIRIEGEPLYHQIYIMYLKNHYRIPAVDRFIKYILANKEP